MEPQQTLPEPAPVKKASLASTIQKALESKRHSKQPFPEYRSFIQHHYDGLAGKLTAVSGLLTGHALLAGQVLKDTAFDLRGCKRILDAGCGNGRHCKYIVKRADPNALVAAFDLSQRMLNRARRRVRGNRVHYVAADLTRLPYPDGFFDAIVCGWVLEHLPDPRPGLKELTRILQPGGKLLLMTTEDTFAGAMTSSLWHCRTYNRQELRAVCEECGLTWNRQLYFTHLHRLFRLGGIIVELRRAL
ncbi:MAG: class I SAM-dependent methyltransferase [Planctomycetes bacterium]|nr:class I SAM-dependent methyltransferase [Planctomycetota bacterium]